MSLLGLAGAAPVGGIAGGGESAAREAGEEDEEEEDDAAGGDPGMGCDAAPVVVPLQG